MIAGTLAIIKKIACQISMLINTQDLKKYHTSFKIVKMSYLSYMHTYNLGDKGLETITTKANRKRNKYKWVHYLPKGLETFKKYWSVQLQQPSKITCATAFRLRHNQGYMARVYGAERNLLHPVSEKFFTTPNYTTLLGFRIYLWLWSYESAIVP